MTWKLSQLRLMMSDAEDLAGSLTISFQELDDRELIRFRRAMEYILNEYFSIPKLETSEELEPYQPERIPKDKGVYEFLLHLDKKLCVIYKELIGIRQNLLGRGYPKIYSILRRDVATYLLGAMIAKDYYDREFSGIMREPGKIYMTFLRREYYTNKDVGCLSGFISKDKPREDHLCFMSNWKFREQEVVWVKDNDLYACSLPYTIILQPDQQHDFSSIGQLQFLGVMYTTRWSLRGEAFREAGG